MRQRVTSILFLLLVGFVDARNATYKTTATCVALVNSKTGGIVYEKNGDERRDPASAMKIATAAVVLENGHDLDRRLTGSQDLIGVYPSKQRLKVIEKIPYALEYNGTHMSIAVGEAIPVRDLLHGLMMVSANDAANILARGLEGSVEEFMRKTALFVEKAGCTGTQFVNPHGLYHPEHYSTAKDMALIMRRAMSQPVFREIVRKKFYLVSKTNKSQARPMAPSNRLIKASKWTYKKSLGGKTGQCYVNGGKNLVSAAQDKGMELIVAVLDCKTYNDCYEQSILLSETAFARGSEMRVFLKAGFQPFKREVRGSSKSLETWTKNSIALPLFRGEKLDVDKKVVWHRMELPIGKGDVVGHVAIFNKSGELLAKEPLLARATLRPDLIHTVAKKTGAVWEVLSAHTNVPGMAIMSFMLLGALVRLTKRRNH